MKNKLNKKSLSQFIKFLVVGLSNTVVSYLCYALLIFLDINYLIANIVSYFIGVLNSFFWNSRYVFDLSGSSLTEKTLAFGKTLMSNAFTGLVLNNVLLFFWVELLGIPKLLGPILNLCISTPLNFVLSKYWAYRK